MREPDNADIEHLDSRERQDLGLLRIFNYYRLALSLILISSYFHEVSKVFLGLEKPSLYLGTALAYGLLNLTLLILLRQARRLQPHQLIGNICIDIIALGLLIYAKGGISSGLDNLMIIVVAAGSILAAGRYSLLFAALASLTLIGVEIYRSAILLTGPHHYFQAGVLGMVLFATALFIRHIAKRIESSDSLARRQATDIAQLEEMNRLIIQRMRTGILVTDTGGRLIMMNDAARHLLEQHPLVAQPPQALPAPLWQRLQQWLENPRLRTRPFQTFPENPEVQANFALLQQDKTTNILVFLDDNTHANQHAQQLKLASLGQLTASIAHEIRNPLGAISHAAQLLSESQQLEAADQRLCKIVQDHSLRMNNIIENVLDLSRRQAPAPQPLALKSWLNEFIESYSDSNTPAPQINLAVEPETLTVYFDPTQLRQVISNLTQNGLRHSHEHTGQARLHFKAGTLATSEQPFLDIIDEGPGIDSVTATRLFEPFYTTRSTGTGLGLYISRELCLANNVRLDHIASCQSGCCFRLTFPHPLKLTG